jgi:hypothetical protein
MNANTRTAAARGFVRSLNILLKFARMYDFGHPRTAKQYETAWSELRTALGDNEAGLLLAVSGDQLLLDGVALESAAAEKSFARMLSAAGIASIHFAPKVTQASLARFVRGFPTGTGAKPAALVEQLKQALQGDPNIHVNEVCFVPADSSIAKSSVAAHITARTLGMDSEAANELFNDPEKLLQLIVAAEGTKGSGGPGGPGGGGPGGGGPGIGGPGGGVGPGNGGSGSGYGPGGGNGPGTGGSGSGFYSGGAPFVAGGVNGPGGGGPSVEGGVSAVSGTGAPTAGVSSTWNIVGGSGGGTQLDANAGGFWLNQEASTGPSSGPGTGSSGIGGGLPVGAAPSYQGDGQGGSGVVGGGNEGTWNITGGSGGGSPLDPNAGGFWLSKGEGGGSASGTSSTTGAIGPAGNAPGGIPVVGGGPGSGFPGATAPGGGTGASRGGAGSGSNKRNWGVPGNTGGDGEAGTPSRWGTATTGIRGSRSARAGAGQGSMAVETGLMTLQEDELQGILQVLAQIARTGEQSKDRLDPNAFQSRLSTLPRRARFTISQALSALAAQAPSESSDRPTLLKLAEHIAIRFALESYERGDIEVNSVRQLLDEMNTELDGLRKILGVYEEKMARAGIAVQSHVDILAQQFWTEVSEEKKRAVLESPDAWCVPPAKVREFVEGLQAKAETEAAEKILRNYANCITDKSDEHRRQAATGLAELASLYANMEERAFIETIRQVGVQLAEERNPEMQSLVGAAFVRLSQEATKKRSYLAVQRAVELIDYVEGERPGLGKNLRPRIAVEDRLPEYIEESLKSGEVPNGLADLLRRLPEPASEHLASRFSRSGFREDCELLVSMMTVLGPAGLEHLRRQLREGKPNEAIDAVGMLARVDLEMLEQVLPERMRGWKRSAHDRVVRQIASSGAPERGRLLLELFDVLDALIRPLAVDEIGMSGEQSADMRLLRLAEGDLPESGTEYLRLKAMEALGRLRTSGAEAVLRKIAEARKTFRWAHQSELRLVAVQAMEKIDAEWVRSFIPRSGLSIAEFSIEPLDVDPESSAIRQRRYPRLRLERPLSGTTTNLKENCRLDIPEMTLGGGVAICEQSLYPGSIVGMRLNPTQKSVKAQTIVRDANTQARAFEVVDIDLEERAKLRKLLVQLGNVQKQSTPRERSKRNTRTILSAPA